MVAKSNKRKVNEFVEEWFLKHFCFVRIFLRNVTRKWTKLKR